MTNMTTSAETIEVAYGKYSDDVTYTVRDPRPEAEYAILAGPFIDLEEARKHQQLHAGSRVYKEELY